MTKEQALELLNKDIRNMTHEERKKLKQAIKIVGAWG